MKKLIKNIYMILKLNYFVKFVVKVGKFTVSPILKVFKKLSLEFDEYHENLLKRDRIKNIED